MDNGIEDSCIPNLNRFEAHATCSKLGNPSNPVAPEFKRENKSKIPNLKLDDRASDLIAGVNLKSKIQNPKLIDW
ncbi:hypothetical protein H1Q63_27535 [Desmonostoc muscorum CCALA 125]|nr:hypothetical protein [Desmonostoc muscorum CCALA 125]